ncbi:helix-turn-helix domain-containing protein [Alkalicella caledoniensis]|uniref:Helix-turn-helix domain-containing protein n=1 Tax=Alkalicella caledoniensis TaxID=2731377 RepID=A0A7G9WCS8_ALKCA|nr:helix-turn-helix domain-containing protein [Alkalicella caledoniensis]QNO16490.1 helix-turn-helix domain-containing protein [Alkalicella caledoniensis]
MNDIIEIGRQLKEAREAKNLSVEDIAQRTKLRKDQVIAIEEGNLSNLPPLAYVKGFVKLYSKVVGLEITSTAAATVDSPIPPRKMERKPMKRSSANIDLSNLIFLVLFISIIAITVYFTVGYFTKPRNTIDLPENSHPIIIDDEDEDQEDQNPIEEEPVIEEAQIELIIENNKYIYEVTNQENLEVMLQLSGQSWVNISTDGVKLRENMLDEDLLIEAANRISMRIGLAANVEIIINGQPVDFSDASNAVNVEINLVEKNGE